VNRGVHYTTAGSGSGGSVRGSEAHFLIP